MAIRPEEAERIHDPSMTRAFHIWRWNFWSCSGPNAGGGQAAELRLAQPFLRFHMIMSRYDKSADARVGGVFGRYPPEVQCIETLLMYSNTNHDGPRISVGNVTRAQVN